MYKELTVFGITMTILYWLSPFIFIAGVFLLFLSPKTYSELENILGREIGGIRKRIVKILENNIMTFHNWAVSKKNIVGLIFIICSAVFFFFKR